MAYIVRRVLYIALCVERLAGFRQDAARCGDIGHVIAGQCIARSGLVRRGEESSCGSIFGVAQVHDLPTARARHGKTGLALSGRGLTMPGTAWRGVA